MCFEFKIKKANLHGSRSGSDFSKTGSAVPDPVQLGLDPQHWYILCVRRTHEMMLNNLVVKLMQNTLAK